jgi:hypothetical protein
VSYQAAIDLAYGDGRARRDQTSVKRSINKEIGLDGSPLWKQEEISCDPCNYFISKMYKTEILTRITENVNVRKRAAKTDSSVKTLRIIQQMIAITVARR